jgi:hypothetical protein
MTWLSNLDKYVWSYKNVIEDNGFVEKQRENGPGMGALIEYQNSKMRFRLINDKLYFEINIFYNNSNDIDLAPLLAFIEIEKEGRNIQELSFEEKKKYWEISYDYKDPLKSFFENIEQIYRQINDKAHLEDRMKSYYEKRGDWLFSIKS